MALTNIEVEDMIAISTCRSLFHTVLLEQAENSDGTVAGHFPDEY